MVSQHMGSARDADDDSNEPKRMRLPSTTTATTPNILPSDYTKVTTSECSSTNSSGFQSGQTIINLD